MQVLESKRKELKTVFDAFKKRYGGFINNKALQKILANDIDYELVSSLQVLKDGVIKDADILFKRVIMPATVPTSASNLEDAFTICINYKGGVGDGRYICALLNGISEEEVSESQLEDTINKLTTEKYAYINTKGQSFERPLCFINPTNNKLEEAEQYLSGLVKDKLATAEQYAKSNPKFNINVQQLELVIPEYKTLENIQFRLGTSWIPTNIVEEFIYSNFGRVKATVKHFFNDVFSDWTVSVEEKGKKSYENQNKGIYFDNNSRYSEYEINGKVVKVAQPNIYDKLGHHLVESCLNNKMVIIQRYKLNDNGNRIEKRDKDGKPNGTYEMEQDDALTNLLQDKKDAIQRNFKQFVIENDAYITSLEEIYNKYHNNFARREWAIPSIAYYPSANSLVKLRDAQKLGVRRSLVETTGNFMGVGVGKTFTIITTAMEAKRMKLANKPMIVVLNATFESFVADAKFLYPTAKILSPNLTGLSKTDRIRTFAKMATMDWDMVILPQSQFELIPDHPDRLDKLINEMVDDILGQIKELDEKGDKQQIKDLKKRINTYQNMVKTTMKGANDEDDVDAVEEDAEAKEKSVKDKAREVLKLSDQLKRQNDRKVDNFLYFEELGIDMLLIDEFHSYKRLGFTTNMTKVKGIDTAGSKKSLSTLLKIQYIHEVNKGRRNVSVYTGTPISNTVAETWTLTKYLNPQILKDRGLGAFDSFVAEYAEVTQDYEMNAGGAYKPTFRLKKYKEIQRLYDIWSSYAYVVLGADVLGKKANQTDEQYIEEFLQEIETKGKPDKQPLLKMQPDGKRGRNNIIIKRSDEQAEQVKIFSNALKWYEKLTGLDKLAYRSIPLQIYNLARRATISLELLPPMATKAMIPMNNTKDRYNKVNFCMERVFDVWQSTKRQRLTQLIFCDSFRYEVDGVEVYNVFKDIKNKLIAEGVPENEIAIINDYTKKKREKLILDINEGIVRIAMGSTTKLGTGLNAQKKLIEVHHIDAPDRPMDFEQRNGRIVRPGNFNPEVNVTTYGIEGTMDAVAYFRLDIKQKFINQIMNMEITENTVDDELDEGDDFFSNMSAMLTGSTTAVDLVKAQKELKSILGQLEYENSQKIIKGKEIINNQKLIEKYQNDLLFEEPFLEKIKQATKGEEFEIYKAEIPSKKELWMAKSKVKKNTDAGETEHLSENNTKLREEKEKVKATKVIRETVTEKDSKEEEKDKTSFSAWIDLIKAKECEKLIESINQVGHKEFFAFENDKFTSKNDYSFDIIINDVIQIRVNESLSIARFVDESTFRNTFNKNPTLTYDSISRMDIKANGIRLLWIDLEAHLVHEGHTFDTKLDFEDRGTYIQSSITRIMRSWHLRIEDKYEDIEAKKIMTEKMKKGLDTSKLIADLDRQVNEVKQKISDLNIKRSKEESSLQGIDGKLSKAHIQALGKMDVDLSGFNEYGGFDDQEKAFLMNMIHRFNENDSDVKIFTRKTLLIFSQKIKDTSAYSSQKNNKLLEYNFVLVNKDIKRDRGVVKSITETYERTFDMQDTDFATNALLMIKSFDETNHSVVLDILAGIHMDSVQKLSRSSIFSELLSNLKSISV